MLLAPITIVHHFFVVSITDTHYFVSHANIHHAKFWFLHYYLLHAIFVLCTDIPCAFHSMHCTIPNFSMPPPCTNTLHASLTKLSRDNINPHCVCTNKIPLRSANMRTPLAPLLCVCAPYYAYAHHAILYLVRAPAHQHFFAQRQNLSHAPTHQHFSVQRQILACAPAHQYFFMRRQNLVCAPAHQHFSTWHQNLMHAPAHQHFSTWCQNLVRASALQYFFAQHQILALAPAYQYFSTQYPIFTYHKIFTVHHAFLVRPPAHIHFYVHQFPVNSAAEIEAFA
jgi:hypothetical protein